MDATAPPGGMEVNRGGPGYSSGGQFGPVIGVLAGIAVMGIVAGVLGRLCSGRTVFGYGTNWDAEAWVEKKCAACLDGNMGFSNGQARHLPPPLRAMESHLNVVDSGGWRTEDISLRPQPPPPLQVLHPKPIVAMRNPPVPHPHLQRYPGQGSGPGPSQGMEVILRPLPRRQGSMGEGRSGGLLEAEITSDEERRKRRGVEEDMSDSTDHDEHHHHHSSDSHQGGDDENEEEEEEQPPQLRH